MGKKVREFSEYSAQNFEFEITLVTEIGLVETGGKHTLFMHFEKLTDVIQVN